MPGLIAIDLAQPVPGPVSRQPLGGVDRPDVDGVPGYVRGRVRGGNPSCRFLFGPVLRDRLTKQLILVLGGAPPAVDEDLRVVGTGLPRRIAQGPKEIGVEVRYAGILVVEDRHAVGKGSVILVDATAGLGRRMTLIAARDIAEGGRR